MLTFCLFSNADNLDHILQPAVDEVMYLVVMIIHTEMQQAALPYIPSLQESLAFCKMF